MARLFILNPCMKFYAVTIQLNPLSQGWTFTEYEFFEVIFLYLGIELLGIDRLIFGSVICQSQVFNRVDNILS